MSLSLVFLLPLVVVSASVSALITVLISRGKFSPINKTRSDNSLTGRDNMQNIDDLNIKIEEEKESSFHRFEIELKADIDRTEIRYQRFKKDLPKEFHSYLEPYEKLLRKLQSERESWAEARENLDDDAKNEIIRDFLAKNPEI